jgi:hypothetical protein
MVNPNAVQLTHIVFILPLPIIVLSCFFWVILFHSPSCAAWDWQSIQKIGGSEGCQQSKVKICVLFGHMPCCKFPIELWYEQCIKAIKCISVHGARCTVDVSSLWSYMCGVDTGTADVSATRVFRPRQSFSVYKQGRLKHKTSSENTLEKFGKSNLKHMPPFTSLYKRIL